MNKEVSEMCNLSIGIEERGIEIGEERKARETNRRLRQDGISLEKRAVFVDYPEETVKKWDEEDSLVLV